MNDLAAPTCPPQPPSPTTYTMRCPWTTASSTGRPARVVATPGQLVFLNALYARAGEDATKEDIAEVSRETGLQEKWIRKWIKRQRNSRNRAKKKIAPQTSSHAPKPEPYSAAPVWHTADPLWQVDLGSSGGAASDTSASAGNDSTCSAEGSWSERMEAVEYSGSMALHTLEPLPAAPDGSFLATSPQSATATTAVQVAHPGASFTVPLRYKPSSQHRITCTIPPDVQSSQPVIMQPLPRPKPTAQGYHSSEFYDAYAAEASTSRAHFSELAPLHIPSAGSSVAAPESILSAPPSAFSLPAPDFPSSGGAYLYRLFNDHGDGSTVPEAPPFYSTCYYGDPTTGATGAPPALWSPQHVLALPGNSSNSLGLQHPPTPVSYQMRLSDLVALTKSIRAAATEGAGPGSESVTQAGDVVGAMAGGGGTAHIPMQGPGRHLVQTQPPAGNDTAVSDTRDTTRTAVGHAEPSSMMGGEETEDEAEVVTPCEDMEMFIEHNHPSCDPNPAYEQGIGPGEVAIADVEERP